MRNKRKPKDSATRESEYQKIFEDALDRLRKAGDVDVIHEITPDYAERAKPNVAPVPYGGKRHNDWVSS